MHTIAHRLGAAALACAGWAATTAHAETPEFSCHRPIWSPDGRSIVFMSTMDEGEDGWELYRMSLDEQSSPMRLTNHPGWDGYASFSPDGSTIVFDRKGDGAEQIWLLDLASGKERMLVDGAGASAGGGRFTPDGKRILFFSEREGNRELYLIDVDGSHEQRLTTTAATEADPCFTADGRQILFATWGDGSTALERMNIDGSERSVVLEVRGRAYGLDLSPDGSHLVFNTDADEDDAEIYMLDLDGGDPVKLTDNDDWDHLALFRPDGKRLLFTSYRSGVEEMYLMDIDGSNVESIQVH